MRRGGLLQVGYTSASSLIRVHPRSTPREVPRGTGRATAHPGLRSGGSDSACAVVEPDFDRRMEAARSNQLGDGLHRKRRVVPRAREPLEVVLERIAAAGLRAAQRIELGNHHRVDHRRAVLPQLGDRAR